MVSNLEWANYYSKEEHLFEYILNNSQLLFDITDENMFFKIKPYIRKIVYIDDNSILENIEKKIENLKQHYFELSKSKKLHKNFPFILKNVESITVSVNNAFQSYKITRNKESEKLSIKLGRYSKDSEELNKLLKLKEKCNLNLKPIFEKDKIVEYSVYISYLDLLNYANADTLQVHRFTGKQYTINARCYDSTISNKYKLGFILLDKQAIINYSNKEAPRKHRLINTLEYVNFGVCTDVTFFIKEKRNKQIKIFD